MNTKESQRVTREQDVRLKKAGFDWTTDNSFREDEHALPTVARALEFIRDKKGVSGTIRLHYSPYLKKNVYCLILNRKDRIKIYYTYESAESALLDELLTLLEKEAEK
jgi:hypothetical protein